MNCTATTRLTAEECLARMDALRPMPRGLRLEAYAEENSGVFWCAKRNPLWLDMFDGDGIPQRVSKKDAVAWPDPMVIRAWAAPVRRLREERRALRARVRELEEHVAAGLWACGGEP
jgi:hypothetical protein